MRKAHQKEIKKVVNQIVKNYKPEKIILFGSFVYGKPKASSDIDLLILKKTKQRKVERIKKVLMETESHFPLEPLVYTPEELKKRLRLGDFFFENIIKKGKIMYEK